TLQAPAVAVRFTLRARDLFSTAAAGPPGGPRLYCTSCLIPTSLPRRPMRAHSPAVAAPACGDTVRVGRHVRPHPARELPRRAVPPGGVPSAAAGGHGDKGLDLFHTFANGASQRSDPVATILETERLVLRELTLDDAEALLEVYSDPEVMRYLGTG